jgi:hypothetical protein
MAAGRGAGQPTRCTPETTELICDLLAAGNFPDAACAMANITTRTYYNWRGWGEDEQIRRDSGEEPDETREVFVQFFLLSTRANARAEVGSVLRIQHMAQNNTVDHRVRLDAEKFLLERRFRDRWGRTRIDVHHEGGVDLALNVPPPRRVVNEADERDYQTGSGDDDGDEE